MGQACGKKVKIDKQKYSVKILTLALLNNDFALISKALFNDLEQVSARLYPELPFIRENLVSLGLDAVLMSGSGSTIFAIAASKKEAVAAYKILRRKGNWRVFIAQTL